LEWHVDLGLLSLVACRTDWPNVRSNLSYRHAVMRRILDSLIRLHSSVELLAISILVQAVPATSKLIADLQLVLLTPTNIAFHRDHSEKFRAALEFGAKNFAAGFAKRSRIAFVDVTETDVETQSRQAVVAAETRKMKSSRKWYAHLALLGPRISQMVARRNKVDAMESLASLDASSVGDDLFLQRSDWTLADLRTAFVNANTVETNDL
jgi:hypothetical protein